MLGMEKHILDNTSQLHTLVTRRRQIGGINGFESHPKKSILDSDFCIEKIDFYPNLSGNVCITH